MSFDAYMDLLGALVDDVGRMRAYGARLEERADGSRLKEALGAFARTEAFKRAASSQTRAAFRMWLEMEVARPAPPSAYRDDPAAWEVVRAHLKEQLAMLGDPRRTRAAQ